jgi:Methyltransferase domain.
MISERYRNDGCSVLALNPVQVEAKRAVDEKVKSNVYKFETVDCAVCSGREFELLAEKDRYGLYCPVVSCRDCGLVQVNPRMTSDSYISFYENEYRSLYVGSATPKQAFFNGQMFQGRQISSFIKKNIAVDLKGKTLVEVGCGAGGILKHFRDLGCTVKGCDLGADYLSLGIENYGLELVHGSIKDLEVSLPVDIVVYSHVFEHILDLKAELRAVKDIMRDDGLLYIEVPGIHYVKHKYRGDTLRYLQNAHVYHFSLRSITNILLSCGFEVVSGTEYVRILCRKSDRLEYSGYVSDFSYIMEVFQNLERDHTSYRFSFHNFVRVCKLNWRRFVRAFMR